MLEGKYERIKKISEGSYGIVYKAVHHSLPLTKAETPSLTRLTKTLADFAINPSTENVSPNGVVEEHKSEKPRYVAIKKLRVQEQGDEAYEREIGYLKRFDHPNVVKLLDVFKRKLNTYLVLEFFETDLEKLINNPKVCLSKEMIRSYMRQILECAKYLHDNKVMHRDFKPSNIFVSHGTLKCGDFGIARDFPKSAETLTKTVCTR
eukprot:TRINITY_DN1272_c0_g3_i3.p1 TRINITY_DN1272_c0_g3~~TRINITY_DN1272_c0_g3_i3.p1  ORF type:complete len:206 (+),score=77.33 TRINITY_DN1272_c0_g3_i3:181-798(+)